MKGEGPGRTRAATFLPAEENVMARRLMPLLLTVLFAGLAAAVVVPLVALAGVKRR